jgi:hypothetical protein
MPQLESPCSHCHTARLWITQSSQLPPVYRLGDPAGEIARLDRPEIYMVASSAFFLARRTWWLPGAANLQALCDLDCCRWTAACIWIFSYKFTRRTKLVPLLSRSIMSCLTSPCQLSSTWALRISTTLYSCPFYGRQCGSTALQERTTIASVPMKQGKSKSIPPCIPSPVIHPTYLPLPRR